MKDDKQIQMAFALWQNMARLEKMLWDRYDKEFLRLLLDSKEDQNKKDDSQDFVF
jgi:hypothetical protein